MEWSVPSIHSNRLDIHFTWRQCMGMLVSSEKETKNSIAQSTLSLNVHSIRVFVCMCVILFTVKHTHTSGCLLFGTLRAHQTAFSFKLLLYDNVYVYTSSTYVQESNCMWHRLCVYVCICVCVCMFECAFQSERVYIHSVFRKVWDRWEWSVHTSWVDCIDQCAPVSRILLKINKFFPWFPSFKWNRWKRFTATLDFIINAHRDDHATSSFSAY